MSGNDKTLPQIPRNSLYKFPIQPGTCMMYHISAKAPDKNTLNFYDRSTSNKPTKYKTAREMISYIKHNSPYRSNLYKFYALFEECDIEKKADSYAYPGKDEKMKIKNKQLYKNQLYIFHGNSLQYLNKRENSDEQKSIDVSEEQPENDDNNDEDITIHNIQKGYATPHASKPTRMTTRTMQSNRRKSNEILSNYEHVGTTGIYMKNFKNSIHISLERCNIKVAKIENVLVQYENGTTDVFINTKDVTTNISTIKEDIRHIKGTQKQAVKQTTQVNKNLKKLKKKVGGIYGKVKQFKAKKTFKNISKQWQNVLTNDVLDVMGSTVGFGKEAVQKIVGKLLQLNPEAAPQLIELTAIQKSHTKHQDQLQKEKENNPAHIYKNNFFLAVSKEKIIIVVVLRIVFFFSFL